MKLVALELSGFRGFAKTQSFDLDADAIVVVGTNGNGKTSLFDGVLWAICGRIPRLAEDSQRVLSLYSESGQARAALTLRNGDGQLIKIIRSYDGAGTETKVSIETPDGIQAGPAAEGRLLQLVWPEAQLAAHPLDALAAVLTRSVYLQQDVLRHFIEPATDQERFSSVSELFGAGRVTELQLALERAKKAWTTSSNQRAYELELIQSSLSAAQTRVRDLTARIAQEVPPVESAAWAAWWDSARTAGVTAPTPDLASRDAARAIDLAIKELDVRRAAVERRLQSLRTLQTETMQIAELPAGPDVKALREQSVGIENELKSLRQKISDEQARLAELRRAQATLQQKDEQLRVLAELALQHLGDNCPVCTQRFDRDIARRHLESLLAAKSGGPSTEPDRAPLDHLLGVVAAKEKEIGRLELAIRSAEQKASDISARRRSASARLLEFGLSERDQPEEFLRRAIAEAESASDRPRILQQQGEDLALRLGRSAAQASLAESQKEVQRLQSSAAELQKTQAARNATGEQAQRIIEGLREAAATVVEERLAQITPVLQNIYARIDPHPSFSTVEFLARVTKGRGMVSTVLRDTVEQKDWSHPPSVLSSSQVNALAVSIFLSFNLGIARPALSALLLDDPLQSLDDVNLLGLVDLLRRTKDRRQLCVSTHDARFANLLARKLRPTEANGRTVVIELEGWHREGPRVDSREVRSDPAGLRLVAS